MSNELLEISDLSVSLISWASYLVRIIVAKLIFISLKSCRMEAKLRISEFSTIAKYWLRSLIDDDSLNAY